MKKYLLILIFTLIFSSCSKEENLEVEQEKTKTPFYIETKDTSLFNQEVLFTKQAKLVSDSMVSVNSQASGKVEKINFNIGDSVKEGQILAILSDNISNYYSSLERAKNNLERAKINYDSTILSLDKTISDFELNYEKQKKSHELLVLDSKEKLAKLDYDLANSNILKDDSKAKLDLDKAILDYENSLVSDSNQINTFIDTTKTSYKNLYISYFDIINYLDEIFGVSDKNRYKNDSFEIYLSAKNSSIKTDTENKLRDLIASYDSFKNTDLSLIDESNLLSYLENLEKKYLSLKDLLDLSKDALKNSVESSSFTQSTINSYSTQIGAYLSSISGNYTAFVSTKNSISSFLNTYKQNRESREEQLIILKRQFDINKDSLESSINRTKIEIENSILNSQNTLDTIKNNLDNAIKNKEITIRSLKNSIKEAEISLGESSKNAGKLSITSPISGIISKKYIDVGQEVGIGTSLFNISGDDMTKASVFVTKNELAMVSIGDKVKLDYLSNEISGQIESISNVASSNFTYEVVIKVLDRVEIIGDFLTVKFVSKTTNLLVPVSIIEVMGDNKATINTIDSENNITSLEVNIGKINLNFVEILSAIPENREIILTDISNYNKEDFEIIRK